MSFVLVGHDSPTGEYPSPVMPIGEREGVLVVAYRGVAGVEFEEIPADAIYERHAVADFEVERDVLFAFSPSEVIRFAVEDEQLFFDAVLQDPRMKDADAFFRLAIAIDTKHPDLVSAELVRARRRMSENAPHYVNAWYGDVLDRLGPEWRDQSSAVARREDGPVPSSPRAVLAPIALAERAFDREVANLRNTLARSSGNGAGEMLEDLRRHVSSEVTLALVGDRVPELVPHIRIPGARIAWGHDPTPPEMIDLHVLLKSGGPVTDEGTGAYQVALERLDVPALEAEPSWFGRVDSGIARLEERIAYGIRDQVRVPRLRSGIERAASIGARHAEGLVAERRAFEMQVMEEHQRLDEIWRAERELQEHIYRFHERCTQAVAEEIARWRAPMWRSAEKMYAAITALIERCQNRIDAELQAWRPFWNQRMADLDVDRLHVEVAASPANETSIRDISFSAFRLATPPTYSRRQHEEFIRRQILDLTRREILSLAERMESVVQEWSQVRELFEAAMERSRTARSNLDLFLTETIGSVERFRDLHASLDSGLVS